MGSFPNNEDIDEYDEIGILKLENDSSNEIVISTITKIVNILKSLFKKLRLIIYDDILNVIEMPQVR